jgi:N-acetylmuramoyl-L-alanine amidase
MRKQLLTMFVPLLVFAVAVVAAAAQAPASQPANPRSELERVNVVRGTDDIRVEISAHGAVTPKLSVADSPARVIVDLPETVMASGQSRIAVSSGGVKTVRIGMDGRTPPTTRIVVDLEKQCAHELTPGPAGKLVLTLHTQATAQQAGAPPTTAVSAPAPNPKSPFSPRVVAAEANSIAQQTGCVEVAERLCVCGAVLQGGEG